MFLTKDCGIRLGLSRVAPFQGFGFFANPVPRASPWAGEFQPFGLTRTYLSPAPEVFI
jgi:hypothetical protein